jgi:hypothetical protein
MTRKPDRLSLLHWQATLVAGHQDLADLGLPSPVLRYLEACLLHGDASQWQAYGNGWSLNSSDLWRKRAKEFAPTGGDAALRESQAVQAACILVQIETRKQDAPLSLPTAAQLLTSWSDEYSKFGLICAGNGLLQETSSALETWLCTALSSKPWPSVNTLEKLTEMGARHAAWLSGNPLTATCFPFGVLVQLIGKAGAQLPELVRENFASALQSMVFIESSERRRRDQWMAKLREGAMH